MAFNLFLDSRPRQVPYLSRGIWPSHVLHKKQRNGNHWCYFTKRAKCYTSYASTSVMQGTPNWRASGLGWLIMFDLYLSHRPRRVPTLVAEHGIPSSCHTWVLLVMSKNIMPNKAQDRAPSLRNSCHTWCYLPCLTISCRIRHRNRVPLSAKCSIEYHVLHRIRRNRDTEKCQALMLLCQRSKMLH